MCGIVGIAGSRAGSDIGLAMRRMVHRGPDAGVVERTDCAGRTVEFGHRRLSILDLSEAANQPFTSGCGNYTIVFNGEIYNHVQLRAHLAGKGYQFRTRSDTEVLVAGIAVEGVNFVTRLNGMFAFAVLDRAGGRIVLVRDTFGIKPLYYRHVSDSFAFASEIGALEAVTGVRLEVDSGYFAEFLLNGFLYEPATGFSGIAKVPPGHVLTVELSSMAAALRPYVVEADPAGNCPSFGEILEYQAALEMQADVPVGVFFSGGLDSSVLVAAAPRQSEAFFVDYGEDQEGDRRFARNVADELGVPFRQMQHTVGELSSEEILAQFREVARGTEEPVSDYTFIATRALSRSAREAGFKVMLSGMGGDELFAGYPRHWAAKSWNLLRASRLPLALANRALRRLPSWSKKADRLRSFAGTPDFAAAYTNLVGYFSASEVSELLGTSTGTDAALGRIRDLLAPVQDASWLRQAIHLDQKGFLAHNLTVTDRASMLESIEVRVPLLTPSLQRYALSLPDDKLISGGKGKLPLRKYLSKHLPQALVNRPKVGFNPPLDVRIGRLGRGVCEDLLTRGVIADQVDPRWTRKLVTAHFEGRGNHTYRIWQLIYFRLWLEEFGQRGAIC